MKYKPSRITTLGFPRKAMAALTFRLLPPLLKIKNTFKRSKLNKNKIFTLNFGPAYLKIHLI